jgi:hypothetical protein
MKDDFICKDRFWTSCRQKNYDGIMSKQNVQTKSAVWKNDEGKDRVTKEGSNMVE